MKMKALRYMFLVGVICLTSCQSTTTRKSEPTGSITDTTKAPAKPGEVSIGSDGGIPIFYNMYLSVEMSSLFKSIGATYNAKMINPASNVEHYNSSTAQALNLGVYAVDLSYSKFFEQVDQAGKCLMTMHKLSAELGIPDERFIVSVERIENNISNKDSLIKIANEIYVTTENNLKDNDRASAAALIIVGGWIEAMYIATNLTSKPAGDNELLERIADQKNSLNNLIGLLRKYENEPVIKTYLNKLTDLSASFAKFDVDPKKIDQAYKHLKEVSTKISTLRRVIVD
jgi:hypothetical protein